jgi:hypothetical protein
MDLRWWLPLYGDGVPVLRRVFRRRQTVQSSRQRRSCCIKRRRPITVMQNKYDNF